MIHLRTFGGLSLESDGARLPLSASQRRRLTLLALLARAGDRGVPREKLLAYFWPDGSTEDARHALDQLVYATRRDLGRDAIESEGGQLRLNPAAVGSDCAEFEARLERGEWEGAVALYAGPFLDGVHFSNAAELERWVEEERGELAARFSAALERLAREAGERGDTGAAVRWWRRRVAAERLNARAAMGLMQALADTGDHAGAMQYARTYAALVRAELGIEPNPEVVALAERLVRDPLPSGSSQAGHRLSAVAVAGRSPERDGSPPSPDGPPADLQPRMPARTWAGRTVVALAGAAALALALGGAFGMRAPQAPSAGGPDAGSVAVLPFEDLSADGSAEYLGDGMSEELIHALAQVPELRVVARTSAFAFKDRQEDIRQIARTLGVSTVVEGSVQRDGDRLRITAQLIDASTGYHLWSGSFDRRMGDALVTRDEIARSLVHAMRPRLTGRDSPGRTSSRTSAPAYHLYLQGRYAWNQRTQSSLGAAVRFFERAIAEDPSYAAAYAGLAEAHDALADGGFAPAEPSYDRAEAAAKMAIRLDSTLAEARAALGHLHVHRWDWGRAEQEFRRALELNPGYAGTYTYYAMPLVMQGRFDEGLAVMRKAQELDPLALQVHGSMGWLLLLAGRHEEAIDQLRLVTAIDSTRASPRARLGLSLVEIGQYDEGIRSLERAVELGGEYYRSSLPQLGYAYAKAGRHADAERIRGRVERALESDSINPYYGAALMAALGRKDRAFALLDHAFRVNRGCLIDLGVDPIMDGLRSDPRYTALVQALGLRVTSDRAVTVRAPSG
ncbi:MAG: tetratricopeptide repeat protein [Gemmatimonadetes bacterium]|nr:tetratricopeptide repeat protein [Gemmatimonadota bacterium]